MLINEVDAIPQRNCLNLSDLKKRRGSTQANTATKLYTLDAFRGKNAQYTQQNKENRRGNRKQGKKRRKRIDRKWFPTAPLYAHAGP